LSYRRNRTFVVARLIVLLFALAAVAFPASGEAAGTGSISGTVTNLSGEPVEEVEEGCESTAADGTYEIAGLLPGNYTLIFWFYGENGIHFYHGARSEPAATLVPVTAGQVTGEVDEMLDITDTSGARTSISGTVTAGATGLPVKGATVCAIKRGGGVRCQATDAAGRYSLRNLEAGTWSVFFSSEGLEPEYLNQAWHERSESEEPDPLVLGDGTNATGIDAVLWQGGEISGTVRVAATGAPLEEIRVCLVEAATAEPLGCEYTASDGSYRFEAVPTGTYKVAFSPEMVEIYGKLVTELEEEAGEVLFPPDGYPTSWWQGQASFAGAVPIELVAPAVVGGVDGLLGDVPVGDGSQGGGGQQFLSPGGSGQAGAGAPVPAPLPLPLRPPPTKKVTRCPHGFVKRVSKGKTKCVRLHKAAKHKPRHKKSA
jgi:hypothetical protein